MPSLEKLSSLERIQFIFVVVILLSMIPVIVVSILSGLWTAFLGSFVIVLVSLLPYILQRKYKINFPVEFQLVLTLFLYASLFLGEVAGFYARFWWWDLLLHTGAGIAFGFISFLILYTLYFRGRITSSAFLIAVFSFTFAVAMGTIWEIFEFTGDSLLGTSLQRSGLVDTMFDNIVNAFGALFVSILGYLYIKKKARGYGIFHHLVTKFLKQNPRFRRKKYEQDF
jgi:hypothetical protein